MNRRRLVGAVLALVVLGVPAMAHADDEGDTTGEIRCYFDVD